MLQRDNDINGILVVDKPANISSAHVVKQLKKIPGINKIGHTGTLDPAATGVLVCPVNRATRLSSFLLADTKIYVACMMLGIETDTQDAEGKVTANASVDEITETVIRGTIREFEGEIDQVPPVFSALKHKGKPLYAYARQGIPVTKPARKVHIAYIRIQDIRLPRVWFEVGCASGTYIRTLCADIGKKLGCGGHMETLRRIKCGGFDIHEAMPLEKLMAYSSLAAMKALVIPMVDALPEMPALTADAALADRIRHGKVLFAGDLGFGENTDQTPSWIKISDENNRLLAVVTPAGDGNRYNYCCVFVNP